MKAEAASINAASAAAQASMAIAQAALGGPVGDTAMVGGSGRETDGPPPGLSCPRPKRTGNRQARGSGRRQRSAESGGTVTGSGSDRSRSGYASSHASRAGSERTNPEPPDGSPCSGYEAKTPASS